MAQAVEPTDSEIDSRDLMMRKRNMLLAITMLTATTAAEASEWTMTITTRDGEAEQVTLPGTAGAVVLVSHQQPLAGDARIVPASASRSVIQQSAAAGATLSYADYRRVYASIPFSRTEYDANPGYRHEATMELILGELRPRIVTPAASGSTVRVNVGWPLWNSNPQPRRYGYRGYSRYPWH